MRKNNKGVTLIALMITIIVLLILAGTTIAVSNIVEKAEEQKIITEMLLIQTKVKILMERASFSGDTATYYIGDIQQTGKLAGFYEYNQQTLNEIGLEGIKLNGKKYFANYQSGDIAYQKGETILKLSDLIGGII